MTKLVAKIQALQKLIAEDEISIANGATPQYDEDGNVKTDMATCGTCGESWNDALITSRTPSPSARCPYEGIHEEIHELRCLQKLLRSSK